MIVFKVNNRFDSGDGLSVSDVFIKYPSDNSYYWDYPERFSSVNVRNRTAEEGRRQTMSDKREKKIPLNFTFL